ncbi:hypothetical protein Nepgr_025643 [Nepenthes gracilis]|uniref:GDSL esterase/lipase EXL3 n=1 Tax=Nepenthes gracilis TaxID=150966 RepID=A0AAD3T6F3_NEPGR|nr:hypothetical protein Nepgr_025643 [Nepenthes gracilis]
MQFKISSRSLASAMLLLSLSVLITSLVAVDGRIILPPNVTVPAVLGFGDSIIDPGNNNHLKTLIKSNFPPYGKDFNGGMPTGRFSNGRIPTDLLVDALNIKKYLPAYLDPSLQPDDLLTGVSFASGASGFDPLTSKIVAVFLTIRSVAMYLIVAGSDDIANTYFDTPFRRLEYDTNSYTDLMINSASSFIQDLYGLGAKRIGVFSAPPIGCVPSQRTLAGGLKRSCAGKYNNAAKLFNSKLSNALHSLNSKFPDSRLVYIDIYEPLLDLILNPHKHGFEVSDKGCCGTVSLILGFRVWALAFAFAYGVMSEKYEQWSMVEWAFFIPAPEISPLSPPAIPVTL